MPGVGVRVALVRHFDAAGRPACGAAGGDGRDRDERRRLRAGAGDAPKSVGGMRGGGVAGGHGAVPDHAQGGADAQRRRGVHARRQRAGGREPHAARAGGPHRSGLESGRERGRRTGRGLSPDGAGRSVAEPAGGVPGVATGARAELLERARGQGPGTGRRSRRSAAPRRRYRISGRLLGGFVPAKGKLVELQAYERGKWRTFGVGAQQRERALRVHATASAPSRSARSFRMRARVRADAAYPFSLGYSKVVRVRVR